MTTISICSWRGAGASALSRGDAPGRRDARRRARRKGFVQCGVNDRAWPASPTSDARATGRASTSTSAGGRRGAASATRPRSSTCRSTPKERFTALQSGEIDVLSRNTTWTLLARHRTSASTSPASTTMTARASWCRRTLGVKQRQGARRRHGLRPDRHHHRAEPRRLLPRQQHELQAGRVREQRRGRPGLRRGPLRRATPPTSRASPPSARQLTQPGDHVILPEVISKEPLGPAVRHGDDEWGDIVRWTLFAMIEAEEFGVTSANVDEMKARLEQSRSPAACSASRTRWARMLGLPNDWAYNIIKQVGNYGESFERNVGMKTPLAWLAV